VQPLLQRRHTTSHTACAVSRFSCAERHTQPRRLAARPPLGHTNPPWLQSLYATLSEQLATSLASSEEAARTRLAQQAADHLARATAQQHQLDLALQKFDQQQAAYTAQSAPGPPVLGSANAFVSAQSQARKKSDELGHAHRETRLKGRTYYRLMLHTWLKSPIGVCRVDINKFKVRDYERDQELCKKGELPGNKVYLPETFVEDLTFSEEAC